MLVTVEALEPFVTILDDDMVSAIKGDIVRLPKDRAAKLEAAGLVKPVATKSAPETKVTAPAEPAAEKPAPRKRAAAKAAPAVK